MNSTSIHKTSEGYIYVGENDGNFIKSTNSGNTWTSVNVCDREISSIITLPDGQIFISTLGRSLFTSTDYGDTWNQITNSNLYYTIQSIVVDSNNYLYADHREKISKSTDLGNTWTLTGFIPTYPEEPILAIDNYNSIYYAYRKVFKSIDEGVTWNDMGGPTGINCILLDSNRVFIGTNNSIYRYDASIPIYVGNNYLPLSVGNKWQYFGKSTSYFQGIYYYGYWLTQIEVTGDTLINDLRYFRFLNDWVRYSEEDKKVYVWYNDSDNVHIDFTLIPQTSFLQFPLPFNGNSIFNTHKNRIGTFKHGSTTLFNAPVNYKGFSFDTTFIGIAEYEEGRYSENIGPYYFSYSNQNILRANSIMMAVLYDSSGNPIEFTNRHKPLISLIPVTIVNSHNFNMTFLVEHHFTVSGKLNFLDSVYLESYYQKDDSIIYNQKVFAQSSSTFLIYTVNTSLDTALLKDNFSFNYRIVAKDKGLIQEVSYSPEIGFYKCRWDFGTAVYDEEKPPLEFFLSQNHPNPFNPTTKINFQIASLNIVTLKIYDVLGREVATLFDGYKDAGYHEVEFNVAGLASGVYYYQLKAGSYIETKKMIYLK